MELTEKQKELCEQSQWDFSDIRALFGKIPVPRRR